MKAEDYEMENIKRNAYAYIRVSTEEQVDGASIPNQIRAIKRYCAEHNIEIVGWYEDDGKSGKTAKRDELQAMLADALVNKGKVDHIVVYNVSRISRNLESYSRDIGYRMAGLGITLRSTLEAIDETPTGKMMLNISLTIHQFDNDIKSQTVKDNMKMVASQGWWQSQPPFGFKIGKVQISSQSNVKAKYRNILVADTANMTSEKIAKVLTKYSLGNMTFIETLKYARAIGLKGKKGGEFSDSTLENMLKNAAYCGYICADNLTDGKMVKGQWDGLISHKTYIQNQRLLSVGKRTFNPLKKETYPLKGTLLCPECGVAMRASAPKNGSGKPSPRYHCSYCSSAGSLSEEKMHDMFLQHLKAITPTEATISLFRTIVKRTAGRQLSESNREIGKLRASQTKIDLDIETALQKWIDGDMNNEEKEIYLRSKDKQRSDLEYQIDEYGKMQRISESTIEYVCNFITEPARLWQEASFETKQMLQQLLFPNGVTYNIKAEKFGTEGLSLFYRLETNKKAPLKAKDAHLVTLLGENWNTFWQELERFDAGFQDIIPEKDV
jgi:site-specific DNA recombinase